MRSTYMRVFQLGFKPRVLVKVVNDRLLVSDQGCVSWLVLPNFSETTDHNIFLHSLDNSVFPYKYQHQKSGQVNISRVSDPTPKSNEYRLLWLRDIVFNLSGGLIYLSLYPCLHF